MTRKVDGPAGEGGMPGGCSARIPAKGLSESEITSRLELFRQADGIDWRTGRIMGYIYNPGRKAEEIGKQAYTMFLTENALDPTLFQSLMLIENELIGMAASHLNGGSGVVGNFTSGGTESILLAVKTARDYARARHPEITRPEMVMPMTAHAAFHKAAAYFDVIPVSVPVDGGFRADPAQMRAAITNSTILMIGSAPSYAHGVVDPIPDLASLALEHGILFHVDACVGGFMLPYYRRLGQVFPDFDFSVPGVTSISMDFHKYAYTPKNASMVLYRSKDLRKHQIFACAQWPGYTVVNTAVQSSKSGGAMAAAWAVMNYIGDGGYLEIARHTREATRKLIEGIEGIDGLRLMARPDLCMLSFTSDTLNVFHIIDEMRERGWYIQAQLSYGSSRKNIHISINEMSAGLIDELIKDLKASVNKARGMQAPGSDILQLLSGIDLKKISDGEISSMMSSLIGTGGEKFSQRMADINEILDSLPTDIRERLLTIFLNDLFIQSDTGSKA